MIKYYLIITAVMSVIAIIAFAHDKITAMREKGSRTPESVLLTLISLGGAVGGLIGMYVFRHKTSFGEKFQFAIGAWASLVIQIAVGVFILLIQNGVITLGN